MLCSRCRHVAALASRQIRVSTSHPRQAGRVAQGSFQSLVLPRARLPARSAASFSPQYSTSSGAAAASTAPAATTKAAGVEKPDYLDEAETAIWDKLVHEFSPTELMVQDVSGGCGSMYGIEIASEKFRGAPMLKQQRMVNAALGDQMKGWHGVQLRTKVPS